MEEISIYDQAVQLLERINSELKDHALLDTINTKMVGVVTDLNKVRVMAITGKDTEE